MLLNPYVGSKNRSIPGLRGERRTGWSLVLGCRLTGTQCDPCCLRANFAQESGERASGGARNSAVQPSAVQGVGDRASSRVTLLPPFFLPLFSCSSTPAPSLPLRLSRPPLLRLHRSHDSRAFFVRPVSYPIPGLWLVRLAQYSKILARTHI